MIIGHQIPAEFFPQISNFQGQESLTQTTLLGLVVKEGPHRITLAALPLITPRSLPALRNRLLRYCFGGCTGILGKKQHSGSSAPPGIASETVSKIAPPLLSIPEIDPVGPPAAGSWGNTLSGQQCCLCWDAEDWRQVSISACILASQQDQNLQENLWIGFREINLFLVCKTWCECAFF